MTLGALLCLLLAALSTGHARRHPLVETKYGYLRGLTVSVKGTTHRVDAFYGIPYAKPPVGPLRFKNPEEPEPWDCPRNATKPPAMCLQYSQVNVDTVSLYQSSFKIPPVSEDCLYLNVFTPRHRKETTKLPVMVFIHGGGLLFWGASYFDGSALSAYQNVVVVSIQYRLGVLGFLCTGDNQSRGNYGLMDQAAALRWVQENIEGFGGDPNSVTLFGGISAEAHVLSPVSKGLFHRAIIQGGALTMPGMMVTETADLIALRNKLSTSFGCQPSSLVQCLMQKSEKEILAVLEQLQYFTLPICVDGVFFPKSAEEILDNKENNDVPILIGFCDQGGGWFVLKLLNVDLSSREAIKKTLKNMPLLDLEACMIPAIMNEYLANNMSDPLELRNRFVDIVRDRMLYIPFLTSAQSYRDSGNPVYFYTFLNRPSLFANTDPNYMNADQYNDLLYVFGAPFLEDGALFAYDATEEEKILSKTMMKYWANFARNGDPNGCKLEEWPQFDNEQQYLQIDLTQKAASGLKEKELQFWENLI